MVGYLHIELSKQPHRPFVYGYFLSPSSFRLVPLEHPPGQRCILSATPALSTYTAGLPHLFEFLHQPLSLYRLPSDCIIPQADLLKKEAIIRAGGESTLFTLHEVTEDAPVVKFFPSHMKSLLAKELSLSLSLSPNIPHPYTPPPLLPDRLNFLQPTPEHNEKNATTYLTILDTSTTDVTKQYHILHPPFSSPLATLIRHLTEIKKSLAPSKRRTDQAQLKDLITDLARIDLNRELSTVKNEHEANKAQTENVDAQLDALWQSQDAHDTVSSFSSTSTLPSALNLLSFEAKQPRRRNK